MSTEEALVKALVAEHGLPTGKERGIGCPDGGACHHACHARCFRATCCEPLGNATWPKDARPVKVLR